jgi:hypothetical protein
MAMNERLFAAGLEHLSGTVVQIRADASDRMNRLEEQLIDASRDAKLATDLLSHALEKIDTAGLRQVAEREEGRRHDAEITGKCERLEAALAGLRESLPDTERRLGLAEQAMDGQQQHHQTIMRLESDVALLTQRLDRVEQEQQAQHAKIHAQLFGPAEPRACEPSSLDDAFEGEPIGFGRGLGMGPIGDTGLDEAYIEEPVGAADNFLGRARRNARHSISRGIRSAPGGHRSVYFFPVLGGLFLVVAMVTMLLLGERSTDTAPANLASAPPMRTMSVSEPRVGSISDTLFVVAPQVAQPASPAPKSYAPPSERSGPSPELILKMANAGDPKANTVLGIRALDEMGAAPVNLADAVRYLSRAAEAGQPVAQFRLGTLYEHAQGVTADPLKAAHWYELSAKQGNRKAMHNLAVFYANGALGKKDLAQAGVWFAKAAALGLTDSQFNLAFLHERGYGVRQSLVEAYKWYAIAAVAGDKEAKARVNVLATQLSAAEKTGAETAAKNFLVPPLDAAVNVPPEAGNL